MIDLTAGLTITQMNTAIAEAAILEDIHVASHDILHAIEHSASIFPSDTNLTCTLTALNTANTFSAWAEIIDSGSTKLSDAFALLQGHLTEFSIEELSEVNTIYMVEYAYGTPKVILTPVRFAGGTKFQSPDSIQRIWGPQIPAGAKVYYRMKTATAVADTAVIHIRYHTEP